MNHKMISQMLGRVLCIEAALLLLPTAVCLIYGEDPRPFLYTILVAVGLGTHRSRPSRRAPSQTGR